MCVLLTGTFEPNQSSEQRKIYVDPQAFSSWDLYCYHYREAAAHCQVEMMMKTTGFYVEQWMSWALKRMRKNVYTRYLLQSFMLEISISKEYRLDKHSYLHRLLLNNYCGPRTHAAECCLWSGYTPFALNEETWPLKLEMDLSAM